MIFVLKTAVKTCACTCKLLLVVLLYTPKQNKISGKSKVGENLVTLPWLLLIIIFNIRRKKTHEDMFLRGKEHEVYSQKWNRKKHFWEKKKYIYTYQSLFDQSKKICLGLLTTTLLSWTFFYDDIMR